MGDAVNDITMIDEFEHNAARWTRLTDAERFEYAIMIWAASHKIERHHRDDNETHDIGGES